MTDKHGLPEHAKRVFEGEFFDVWQWTQKMYDGTEAIFESVVRDDSTTVIAAVGEKITTRLISFDEFLVLGEHPAFYSRELIPLLIRSRYDRKAREDLHRALFKK